MQREVNRRAQVTLFVILGILIIGGAILFFVFRDTLLGTSVPATFEPAYETLLSCISSDTEVGLSVLGSQGGYITPPPFEAGSSYMPFSSRLLAFGTSIPYWYYVSGNGVSKEQVPTINQMQTQLSDFIAERVRRCDLSTYTEQGFSFSQGTPKVATTISSGSVLVDMSMPLSISYRGENVSVSRHRITVSTPFGSLYDTAVKLYSKQQEKLFLETYAVDTLRLYAPVDGINLSCAPAVWNANEVFDQLAEGIEANTLALKTKGGDYTLSRKENQYFVIDFQSDKNIRFLTSRNWSNMFEVSPSEGPLLVAKPVGNQPGLGILGFCYVPYHFVYNVGYPVLIQVSEGNSIFQFPFAVVIRGNNPRQPVDSEVSTIIPQPQICSAKTTPVLVNTYDLETREPIQAQISYDCLGATCSIGETDRRGNLESLFPQCVNGYVTATASGYQTMRAVRSTIQSDTIDLFLERLQNLNVSLLLDGQQSTKNAFITFSNEFSTTTILYPSQKSVSLASGQYTISAYVYQNGSISLPETNQEQCIDVPSSGIGGLLGAKSQQCFDVTIPEQIVSSVLIAGGTQNTYILADDLLGMREVMINAPVLETPENLEDLQKNSIAFETKKIEVTFR